jgi:hypothetical protein
MIELPNTLEDAIAQSREAVKSALNDGQTRIQVELVFPEIALQAQSITQQFISEFPEIAEGLKIFFPDTGAAALARRDWGEVPFKISDLGSSRSPIANKIDPEDQVFLLINASSIEVGQVEQLSNIAGSRTLILLNPRLEDAATIGIGYAGRQLRDRFLSTLQSCYHIRPLESAALFRCYPQPWQLWLETAGEYKIIAETSQKPTGEEIDRMIGGAIAETNPASPQPVAPKKKGFLGELQTLFRALTH